MFYLALAQGGYFFITGVWPLLHIRSFMRITGPKTDWWLVRTVGALVAIIGMTLWAVALSGRGLSPALLVLAIGSAAALATVDVVYVFNGTIARIYLLDALVEVVVIVGWVALLVW
jgi:hypothetical protein